MAQKHFLLPYMEAEAQAANGGGALNSNSANNLGGSMMRQSSSSFLFSVASNAAGGFTSSMMERQGSSVLYSASGAAAAAADAVKSIAPLQLKNIRAAEISVYGGDLLIPSPAISLPQENQSAQQQGSSVAISSSDDRTHELQNIAKNFAKVLDVENQKTSAKSHQGVAVSTARHLLLVVSAVLNTLLAQDKEGDQAILRAHQQNLTMGADSNNFQNIGFTVLQLSSLSLQCFSGAATSPVTAKTLGKRDPSAWIGISKLVEILTALAPSAVATGSVELFPAGCSSTNISIAERRALLLSVLPDVACLLHQHLRTLLLQIDALVSESVHTKLVGNLKAIKKSTDSAAPATATSAAPSKSLNSFRTASAEQNSPKIDHGYSIHLSDISPASQTLTTLQTTFVVLTRVLQLLRHISDTLFLSAKMLQQQQANGGTSEMSRQHSTVATPLAPGDKGVVGYNDHNHQEASAATNPQDLLSAKALVQRASFTRVLFASLQNYLQRVLATSAPAEVENKKVGKGSVALANQKLRNQLTAQHFRLLQNLPAAINLIPSSDDRDMLSTHTGTNSAYEIVSNDHLGAHQQQLQSGVTPSSAIACSLAAAAATTSGRYSANAAAPPHVARNRTAVASLMTLIHRRAKRSRRPLANSLEMWASFVPAVVLDVLEDETKDDYLQSAHHHKHNIKQAEGSGALMSSPEGAEGSNGASTNSDIPSGFASSPQIAVATALDRVALPHQFSEAVKYWTLCNSISAAEGTSGYGTCSSVSASSIFADLISSIPSDISAATMGARLYSDGLAWLRNIGESTSAELLLFQQLSSTHTSSQAAAAAAAAEQQHQSSSTSHSSDPWHGHGREAKTGGHSGSSASQMATAAKPLHHHYQGSNNTNVPAPTSGGSAFQRGVATGSTSVAVTTPGSTTLGSAKPAWGSSRVAANSTSATATNHTITAHL
eukprot:GILI01000910.1.p1 GENE.GILI01000910.1~~GILI01000910.1.p1  ORF type:complete len:1067 (+),score=225.39 GILI01000910.1:367-3201(+)